MPESRLERTRKAYEPEVNWKYVGDGEWHLVGSTEKFKAEVLKYAETVPETVVVNSDPHAEH